MLGLTVHTLATQHIHTAHTVHGIQLHQTVKANDTLTKSLSLSNNCLSRNLVSLNAYEYIFDTNVISCSVPVGCY